jgi:ADP-ribose pyrophosphatase
VQRLDAGEFIELCLMSETDLQQRAAAGELSDMKTVIGLLWLQQWRAGLWPLNWLQPGAAAAGIMAR